MNEKVGLGWVGLRGQRIKRDNVKMRLKSPHVITFVLK